MNEKEQDGGAAGEDTGKVGRQGYVYGKAKERMSLHDETAWPALPPYSRCNGMTVNAFSEELMVFALNEGCSTVR